MATLKLGSKAEAFKHEGHTWKCLTELASDVVVEVGEMSFHLHKFPLVNRSGLLRRMISEFCGGDAKHCVLTLHDIPGGARAFELVVKFCYDIRIELDASSVVPLRCAAEHLLMTDDYVQGNLITQTESFLNEVVLDSWKYSIEALEECSGLLPHAERIHIVARCIDSLVSKACLLDGPSTAGAASSSAAAGKGPQPDGDFWNGIVPGEERSSRISNWWYATASSLSLPFFRRFVVGIAANGMEPENIAGFIMFSAKRLLPGLSRCSAPGTSNSSPSEGDQRVALEEIVDLLPASKGVTPPKFLLGLLRRAVTLRASASCRENLERRIGAQLEEAAVEDLLIPNLGKDDPVETLYDVDCVRQILAHFMSTEKSNAAGSVDEGGSMAMVAKLVDGYLAEVATDVSLTLAKFLSLAAVIPYHARPSHDDIYRAIDIYLKAHPWLTESEKEQVCQLVNCQKLSLEACTHAAQNERLPLRLVVQVLFFEQLHLRTSISSCFVVSESVESSQVASDGLVIHKSTIEAIQADVIGGRAQDDDGLHLDVHDMRTQVLELQKECLRMKQEIEKLWKPKSSWNVLSRIIGFAIRSQSVCSGK